MEAPEPAQAGVLHALEDFQPHVGGIFPLHHDSTAPLPLTLVSATANPQFARDGGRAPFTLLFRTPATHTYPSQGTWEIDHPALGRITVFLVPIGPDATGMCLEAVFN